MKYGKDPRFYNIMSKEFVGDDLGNVTGVRAVEISWVKVGILKCHFLLYPCCKLNYQYHMFDASLNFSGNKTKQKSNRNDLYYKDQ